MFMRYIIGVGAQKAGTSWLADYLNGHDEIMMSPIKELHFFDEVFEPDYTKELRPRKYLAFRKMVEATRYAEFINDNEIQEKINDYLEWVRIGNSLENYKFFMESRAKEEHKAVCEITPAYSILNHLAYKEMKRLSDDVRIVFILRDPIDRFWSSLRMHYTNEDIKKLSVDNIRSLCQSDVFRLKGDYRRTCQELVKAFPSENIYTCFYENLFSDSSIENLCAFLSIKFNKGDYSKIVRKSNGYSVEPSGFEARALEFFMPLYLWAYENFGDALPERWKERIIK